MMKIVQVTYTVKDASTQRLLQQTETPQEFLLGRKLMLDDFEQHLSLLAAGDRFRFTVSADKAYGPIDPHAIFDLPLSTFAEEDGSIDPEVVQVGHVFPMEDKHGNRHFGKIIRKMNDSVTMDFNHPFAGKDLLFEGILHAVRPATEADLANYPN